MAKKNISHKRLQELEYNVYKKDAQNDHAKSGCLSNMAFVIIGAVAVLLIVLVAAGKTGTMGIRCAKFGCNNLVSTRGAYCRLHTSSGNGVKKQSIEKEDKEKDKKEEEYKSRFGSYERTSGSDKSSGSTSKSSSDSSSSSVTGGLSASGSSSSSGTVQSGVSE